MLQFLKTWLSTDRSPKATRERLRVRLSVEHLEVRATPANFEVTNTSGFATVTESLPARIIEANNTDGNHTITFAATITQGMIPLNDPLQTLLRNITIIGPGTELIVSPAAGKSFRVFSIAANKTCEIELLTIKNGKADFGAGIYNLGTLNLDHVDILYNEASQQGGGVYNGAGASLNLDAVTFENNKAVAAGGGLYNNGTVTASSSNSFHLNQATGNAMVPNNFGGGIYNSSSIDFGTHFVQIYECSAKKGGGVYTGSSATFQMLDGSIDYNTASADGGGIYSEGTTTVTSVEIEYNSAARGGGFFIWNGDATFTNCPFTGNTATVTGPGGVKKTGLTVGMGGCTGQWTGTWEAPGDFREVAM